MDTVSEGDPKNPVQNICDNTGRPWLCGKQQCCGVLKAEFQLERTSYIGFIDVGNFGSAFIQVDVGRSSWPSDHSYVTLLPTATLMSPTDSRQGKGGQGVRMFKNADFLPQAAEESWDRLMVTCTQPFNKHSQFGLSFLRLRTAVENTEEISAQEKDSENQGTPIKIQSVRDWLSSPAIQHTFFGQQKGGGCAGEDQRNHGSLSRAERMVTVVQSRKRSLHLDPPSCSPKHREAKIQNTQLEAPPGHEGSNPHKCRRRSKTRQEQANLVSTPKKSNAAEKSLTKFGQKSAAARPGTETNKSFKHSPVKTHTLAPTQNIAESPKPPESVCPICGVSFSPHYLPFHASSCLDSDSFGFSDDREMDIRNSLSPFSIRDELMVSCPLCSLMFPPDCIEQHASTCGDTVWVD
ncbi:short transient receptor potential channel 2 isoform X2 [Hoplias malabaricus]|uniref:short transient receptor potential channel 2 isoform X2 n=1 Tax=Hoplias malabaricus TaxID=27720 RepID=UPI0034626E9F